MWLPPITFIAHARLRNLLQKIENSLSGMMSEGFEKIQTKSAERVRSKLNKVNRQEN